MDSPSRIQNSNRYSEFLDRIYIVIKEFLDGSFPRAVYLGGERIV